MLVASPRNQRYLQEEVVGFRRPLRLYGRPEHRRQIAPQLNLKRLAGLVWSEHPELWGVDHEWKLGVTVRAG